MRFASIFSPSVSYLNSVFHRANFKILDEAKFIRVFFVDGLFVLLLRTFCLTPGHEEFFLLKSLSSMM